MLEEEPFAWLKSELDEEYLIESEIEYLLVIKPERELAEEESKKYQ